MYQIDQGFVHFAVVAGVVFRCFQIQVFLLGLDFFRKHGLDQIFRLLQNLYSGHPSGDEFVPVMVKMFIRRSILLAV